jgi:hypothetical protein
VVDDVGAIDIRVVSSTLGGGDGVDEKNMTDFFKLLKQLNHVQLLSFRVLWHLLVSLWRVGTSPMALLRMAAKLHSRRLAVIDERGDFTYAQLYNQAVLALVFIPNLLP